MQSDFGTWKDRFLIGLSQEHDKQGNKSLTPSIIGRDLVVRGDIASQGDIEVDGTIEGELKGVTIRIGDDGSVSGTISGDSVLIAGTVSGKIRSKALVLTRTARVHADLSVDTLTIDAGARFEGACVRFSSEGEAAGPAKKNGRTGSAKSRGASSS